VAVHLTDGTAARLACGLKTKFHPPLAARLNELVAQARG
jgi:hypothetical protein